MKTWKARLIGASIAALGVALGIGADLYVKKAYSQAVTTTQLPAATVTAVTTSAVQIAPTNPGRRTFSVCNNAGSANPLFVLPGTTPVVTTANGIAIAAGTCLNQPTNAVQSGTALGGGNSWQAITAGSATAAFIEW